VTTSNAIFEGPGKWALVTGGNRGLGFECCRQLAESGCKTVLAARSFESAREAAAKIDSELVIPVELDVTSEDSVTSAITILREHSAKLDVLINNAGIYPEQDEDTTALPATALSQALETNVVGVHRVTQACLPLLQSAPAARIVNVSSGLGSFEYCAQPDGEFANYIGTGYGASKAALNMLTATWAKALANSPIKINAVSPGWCRTDMGGSTAMKSAADGAATLLQFAFLGDNGPHGRFLNEDGEMPW
jgi:NAD(P)-dependent dehydrogenase (short-subunit alcohol dehydrogenase family)